MSLTPYHTYDGPRENFATSIGFGIEASRLESAARYMGDFCSWVSRLVLVVMTVSVFYGRNRGTGQLGETQIWEIARSGQFPTNPTNAGLQQMGSVRQVASLRTISVFLVRRLEPQRTPPPAPGPVTTLADPSAVQSKSHNDD
ncbi:hypothetical protein CPAR01_15254 [Colletotrichum paranaense]|uniref:Uncharacterized protein n=1 Tax=Colletotrichum paranaense TaxID=1914294 RepID=A0ABQ9RZV2_9PEZI|nr:uncharacterized protein CPAR01_15254 [Colletotrichum paranaense]KAK1520203.1 hypothetical protein CPAR01_15254 [Colletotrichum paranaense]